MFDSWFRKSVSTSDLLTSAVQSMSRVLAAVVAGGTGGICCLLSSGEAKG